MRIHFKLSVLFAITLACAACGDSNSGPLEADPNSQEANNTVPDNQGEPDNQREPNGQEAPSNQGDPDDDGFTKPDPRPTSEVGERYFYPYFGAELVGPYQRWGREHMRSTADVKESWLYEDEYFVLDGHYTFPDFVGSEVDFDDLEDQSFDVQIFAMVGHDFVPIRVKEVHHENDYPSMEAIEMWSDDDFQEFWTVGPFEDFEFAFNYTLVIPPESFPEKGAYNIRIFAVPVWKAGLESRGTLRRSLGGMNRVHTVYVNGESFKIFDQLPDRQNDEITWHSKELASFLSRRNNMLIKPSRSIIEWYDSTADEVQDSLFNKTFSVDESTIELELFVANNLNSDLSHLSAPHSYYVIQDNEVVDRFIFRSGEADAWPWVGGDEKQVWLPLEVELPEGEPSTIQVFAVPTLYEAMSLENIPDYWRKDFVPESNALLLEYTPSDE